MPIIDLQRRQTEVGRIRLGQKVPTQRGGTRPAKLDRLRFTSPTRRLIDAVAELYGGVVAEWEKQFEVITDAREVPVIVPPQPISQWYELWSGGGCKRRCDGQREILRDQACPCGPDPADRDCKPTTRLNLMLAEVPGLGVWRLESHGYYAATELGGLADLFATVSRPVPARLELQQREVKKDGEKPKHFAVPVLHFDVIPGQVVGAIEGPSGNGTQPAAVAGADRAAIEAAPAAATGANNPQERVAQIRTAARLARDRASVRRLFDQAKKDGVLDVDGLREYLTAVANGLPDDRADAEPVHEGEVVPAPAAPLPDVDTVWSQLMAAVPEDWSTSRVEQEIRTRYGVDPDEATAAQLAEMLADLTPAGGGRRG